MSDPTHQPLTFVFTDLESSTRLWESFPDAMREAVERHDAILSGAVTEAGGHVVKVLGDGLMAVFPSAPDGLRACLEAQRLLRRLCPACREPVPFHDLAAHSPALARHYGRLLPPETPLWAAPGCSACAGTGGFDRVVVAEVLPIAPAIAGAIEQQRSVEAIRALAGERGFQPIGVHAMALVRQGVVGLLDADRVLGPTALFDGMAAR